MTKKPENHHDGAPLRGLTSGLWTICRIVLFGRLKFWPYSHITVFIIAESSSPGKIAAYWFITFKFSLIVINIKNIANNYVIVVSLFTCILVSDPTLMTCIVAPAN